MKCSICQTDFEPENAGQDVCEECGLVLDNLCDGKGDDDDDE